MIVAGVDGCKDGWFVVLWDLAKGSVDGRVVQVFTDLLVLPERPRVIAIDIPIGLLAAARHGGRECDAAARGLLLWPRRNSVFTPPVRTALAADDYRAACAVNAASSAARIQLSKQCHGLFSKLREVDAAMRAEQQAMVFEVHPELSFYEMAGGVPAMHGKKDKAGFDERIRRLGAAGFPGPVSLSLWRPGGVTLDDVLDACAACWTARRIVDGTAVRIPADPPADDRGLRMEMWR